MKDSDMPVEFRIFVEGIIAGLISGIGFKTGISPDEGSILILIMKEFCKATEGMPIQFNCWGFVILLTTLAIVITLFSIFAEITKVEDWKIGLLIYGAGGFLGFLLIIFSI